MSRAEFSPRTTRSASRLIAAVALLAVIGEARAQAGVDNWLRLEGYQRQDRIGLEGEQRDYEATVAPRLPSERRYLQQRYLREDVQQRRLFDSQKGRESQVRARRNRTPLPESQVSRDLRNQRYRNEQRQQRLRQDIQRRSGSWAPRSPSYAPPRVRLSP